MGGGSEPAAFVLVKGKRGTLYRVQRNERGVGREGNRTHKKEGKKKD